MSNMLPPVCRAVPRLDSWNVPMQHSLDRRALLAQHWILRQLSDAELDRLLRYVRVERFDKNRQIFSYGDIGRSMMAVITGRVKLSRTVRGGKEVILNIAGPGDIFGEIALLDELERTADAATLEDTNVLVIERRDFLPILEDNAKLCIQILRLVCSRLRRTTDQLGETLYLTRSARLAKALLRLAREHGVESVDGTQIPVKLSQRDLGNIIGLTRESLNKQLGVWRDGRILTFDDGKITICDIETLNEISEAED